MPTPHPSLVARADWFAARALLATRRLRPAVPAGLLAFVSIFAVLMIARGQLADRAASTRGDSARSPGSGEDTLPLLAGLATARSELAMRDSQVRISLGGSDTNAFTLALTPRQQQARDSLRQVIAQLDGALDRAAKAPLAASYRVLAGTRALQTFVGVKSLVDTLDLLDRARLALDPVEAPQREFAQLTQRANAIGGALQRLGRERRGELARQVEAIAAVPLTRDTSVVEVQTVRVLQNRARASVIAAESALTDARQWHAMARARADSTARQRAGRILGASPLVAATAGLILVVAVTFTLAVAAEARRPTIANAREVERMTGVPVLGIAHPANFPREGRARLRPGAGVDPFRMLYLALTSSGTRERLVCITGDDVAVVAAVAGQLAVCAATDERATLVVDMAAGTPCASQYFGERPEPGYSEAIAAVRLWREVARPVGASEGLAVDVIPAGAPRADAQASVELAANRREFHLFLSDYDFAVIAAPTATSVATAEALCERPATIYAARIARTTLAGLRAELDAIQQRSVEVHGVLLVDQDK